MFARRETAAKTTTIFLSVSFQGEPPTLINIAHIAYVEACNEGEYKCRVVLSNGQKIKFCLTVDEFAKALAEAFA